MKIVIDARIINSSTGRYIERLVHHLEEIDTTHQYILLTLQKDIDFYQPKNPNFSVVAADFDQYSFSEQTGLLRLLNKLKPDLVHFCMPQQPILYKGKHVTTVHDLNLLKTYNSDKNFLTYKFKQFIGRFVFFYIARSSARIICPTNYVKTEYQKFAHISKERITVTYEGSALPVTKKPVAYASLVNKPYIMYVGQQSDYKNIRRLMQAHQILRRTHSNLQLVLVGRLSGKNGPPLVANKKWAEKQGFEGILFTDFVPDEQLVWLFSHCQAYVFPSLMEGFGLPSLEAMSYGAPVVSSNATCLPEVNQDGAEYFDPFNVEEMAQTIDKVISDEKVQTELRAKGANVAATYSWRKMAQETHDIYISVLEQK